MKMPLSVLAAPLLSMPFVTLACAQNPTQTPQPFAVNVSFDLLSDTGGGQALAPYLDTLHTALQQQWTRNVTAADLGAMEAQYETTLSLSLAPDGTISALKLDHAVENATLDKAAWAAATGVTYAPLPAAMEGSPLKLRVHFIVD